MRLLIISIIFILSFHSHPAISAEDAMRAVKRNQDKQASTQNQSTALGDFYALIIGINDYEDNAISDLETAVNDGEALAAVLTKDYGFKVTTLLDRQASWGNIDKELQALANKAKEKDSVLIYYAGHGNISTESKKEEGWWYPADSVQGDRRSYFNNDKIRAAMDKIPARHVLLVSDSCFAGSLFGTYRSLAPDKSQLDKYYGRLYKNKSRWGLTSGGKEPVMDGGSDGHSVFAYHFLHHLQNADRPVFSVRDLHLMIARTVTNNSRQKPECLPIRNIGHMGGEFVFIRRGTELSTFSPIDIPALEEPPPSKITIFLFAGIALFVTGSVLFFFLLKPRQLARNKEKTLRQAMDNRDRQQISKILSASVIHDKELQDEADKLTGRIAGLRLEGLANPLYLAPGPKQGFGRGEKWVFNFSDPHVSRRPHAWLSMEDGNLLLQKEIISSSEIRINNELTEGGTLQQGDCFQLGSLTVIEVEKCTAEQGAFLRVIEGPEVGIRLIMLTGSAMLGSDLAGQQVRCGALFWQNGRPKIRVTEDENKPLATMATGVNKVLLADNDILKVGSKDLVVHLIEEKQ